jgi:hypothetical protein
VAVAVALPQRPFRPGGFQRPGFGGGFNNFGKTQLSESILIWDSTYLNFLYFQQVVLEAELEQELVTLARQEYLHQE